MEKLILFNTVSFIRHPLVRQFANIHCFYTYVKRGVEISAMIFSTGLKQIFEAEISEVRGEIKILKNVSLQLGKIQNVWERHKEKCPKEISVACIFFRDGIYLKKGCGGGAILRRNDFFVPAPVNFKTLKRMKNVKLNIPMNPEISRNITLLRYPAIIMVVMIHNVFEYAPLPKFCEYFQRFFSYSFPQAGVPIFFAASGYLLFHKAAFENAAYPELVKRRFQSLIIPYIFWNAAILAFYLLGPHLPVLGKFFVSGKLDDYQCRDYVLRAFGITGYYPIALQFWFIRNLFIFVLLYPLFLWIMRKIDRRILAVAVIAILFLPKYPFEGLSYFLIGGILAVNQISLESTRKYQLYLALVFAAGVVLYVLFLWPMRISLLCGVLMFYHLASWCGEHEKIKQVLLTLAPSSIFVFAAHVLFSGIIRRAFQKIFMPQSSLSLIIFYFLALFITIAAMTGLYFVLKKICPKILKFVCGR